MKFVGNGNGGTDTLEREMSSRCFWLLDAISMRFLVLKQSQLAVHYRAFEWLGTWL